MLGGIDLGTFSAEETASPHDVQVSHVQFEAAWSLLWKVTVRTVHDAAVGC